MDPYSMSALREMAAFEGEGGHFSDKPKLVASHGLPARQHQFTTQRRGAAPRSAMVRPGSARRHDQAWIRAHAPQRPRRRSRVRIAFG